MCTQNALALSDQERLAYISGRISEAETIAKLIAANEAIGFFEEQESPSSITDKAALIIACQQIDILTNALNQIANAAGNARQSELKKTLMSPIKRAIRARIDLQDAIATLNTNTQH